MNREGNIFKPVQQIGLSYCLSKSMTGRWTW